MSAAMRSRLPAAAGLAALALAWGAPSLAAEPARPLLHPMFQDHAVLQRDQPIRLYGQAAPGAEVRVAFGDTQARVRAGADGRWEARLPAMAAGGPHALAVSAGGATQSVDDVLVGDVWLCSGQSNMELQVWRTLDARAEIAGAGNDRIRLLTVPQVGSSAPLDVFDKPVSWQPVNPESVRDFSAACYYFARELQKTVDVPMGLVAAAWGGSRIQAWTSGDALRTTGHYDDELDVLEVHRDDAMAAVGRWGEVWARWWRGRDDSDAGDTPWTGDAASGDGWQAAPPQLGAWERWGVPAIEDYNGMVWYRSRVELTAAQAAQGAVLALGPADEVDMTWVNGRAVGSTYGAGDARAYTLPAGLLRPGANSIVVNVLDTYRDGGLAGPASAHALRLADGSTVALGGWEYRAAPGTDWPPRAPWQSAAGLSTLYNGMIAPIGRYGLRGMLWYQGESNTFEADRYRELLAVLRDDWRTRFSAGTPFLVAQLANYGPAPSAPAESEWAALREAQRAVVAEDARSALVVAIDIGDRYDIHPANKQELGRRFARAARRVVYGESLPPTGPVAVSARREGDTVVVAFDDVTAGLVAIGGERPLGFETCGAAGSCRYAGAEVRGDTVVLHDVPATATRVRHAWADSPVVTLFDGAVLPAGPFELPIQ
jgi:sialate O-acetylesterase